ncbi:MAG: TIGR04211 family SH3 domain-containing protein [Myxococcota bacterium]
MKSSVLAALVVSTTLCICTATSAAPGDAAWVKGAPLNLRSGAGTQYRILATSLPGERVEILEETERWTKVRKPDGTDGWIAAGYLDPKAPPLQRVGLLEADVERLTRDLDAKTSGAATLLTETESLKEREATREAELARLTQENLRYRAGARWPEWATGALILCTGMALGAVIRQVSGGRRQNRLRF